MERICVGPRPRPETKHLTPIGRTSASALLAVLTMLTLAAAGCTDALLARYRNDELLRSHRYALGERYVKVGDLRVCYQDFGRGDPVIILPGLGTTIDYWQLAIPALSTEHRVLALDLPGFGKSGKPDTSYEMHWLVDRIRDFMDTQGVERASFIGGSMGGQLAVLMSLRHPERVDKLVLMGSSGNWPKPGPLLDFGIRLVWSDATVTDYLRRNWARIHHRILIRQTPLTAHIFRYEMALRANRDAFFGQGRASARALRSILYTQVRDELHRVTAPTLLIWGAHDPVHPVEWAVHFRENIPNSRLVVVRDAAHEVMLDAPEAFNETVLRFLDGGVAAVADQYPGNVPPDRSDPPGGTRSTSPTATGDDESRPVAPDRERIPAGAG